MTDIIALGQFLELDVPSAPSIRDAIGAIDTDHRDALTTYLEGGVLVTAVPGLERDVIDGTPTQKTFSYRTDGLYIWHAVLAHYVRKYGVRLHGQFVDMVLGGAAPPASLDEESDAAVTRWLHDDHERKLARNKKP